MFGKWIVDVRVPSQTPLLDLRHTFLTRTGDMLIDSNAWPYRVRLVQTYLKRETIMHIRCLLKTLDIKTLEHV